MMKKKMKVSIITGVLFQVITRRSGIPKRFTTAIYMVSNLWRMINLSRFSTQPEKPNTWYQISITKYLPIRFTRLRSLTSQWWIVLSLRRLSSRVILKMMTPKRNLNRPKGQISNRISTRSRNGRLLTSLL
jgi:hypothetical protein